MNSKTVPSFILIAFTTFMLLNKISVNSNNTLKATGSNTNQCCQDAATVKTPTKKVTENIAETINSYPSIRYVDF